MLVENRNLGNISDFTLNTLTSRWKTLKFISLSIIISFVYNTCIHIVVSIVFYAPVKILNPLKRTIIMKVVLLNVPYYLTTYYIKVLTAVRINNISVSPDAVWQMMSMSIFSVLVWVAVSSFWLKKSDIVNITRAVKYTLSIAY